MSENDWITMAGSAAFFVVWTIFTFAWALDAILVRVRRIEAKLDGKGAGEKHGT